MTEKQVFEINGRKIIYSRLESGEIVVSMTPGRPIRLNSRLVPSKRSTVYPPTELKAWERVGEFVEFAKNPNPENHE